MAGAAHAEDSEIDKARELKSASAKAKALPLVLKEHDVKLSAAQQAKALAEAKKKAAEAKKDAATKTLKEKVEAFDAAASRQVIESGVSAGVAALVHVPFKKDWGQSRIESGHSWQAAPYVVILPRYLVDWWGGSPERARYCASRWTADEATGQRAADTLAKERGQHMAEILINRVRAGVGQYARILTDESIADRPALRVELLRLAELAAGATETAPIARATLGNMLAEHILEWAQGVPARCGSYSIGFWLTPFPSSTTVDVRRGRTPGRIEQAKVKRWTSFGLAWVPSAYVSVLAGASYGSMYLETELSPGVTQTDSVVRYWSGSLGLTINLDAVTALK